jgi:hypothetical protein
LFSHRAHFHHHHKFDNLVVERKLGALVEVENLPSVELALAF